MSIELQNAYEASKQLYREQGSGCQKAEVERLRLQGKWVYGYYLDIHCRYTDALITAEMRILSVHNTREEAEAAAEDSPETFLFGPDQEPDPEVAAQDDGTCPF